MEVIMLDSTQQTSFQIAWINFVKSGQVLLVLHTDYRPLDQYLSFRDAVLILVQSEKFLKEITKSGLRQQLLCKQK